jgi:CheY-like chemotaxis protein
LKDFSALSFDVVVREDSVLAAAIVQPQLRQAPGSARDRQSGESDPARIEERGSKTPPARVLIADDTPSVRESLAKMLRAEGYEAEVAANGQEALEKFDPARIDLVLMDLDMPVTNGWDALAQLMAIHPDQAVIIITGKAEPSAWAGVGRTGILVEKPINVPALLDSIRQALTEPASLRKERIAVQRKLTRHTRPLPDTSCRPGFHGALLKHQAPESPSRI